MNYNQALSRCMSLCSKREYCQSEIAAKLNEWQLPEKVVAEVLHKLVSEKFIDNLRYAKAFTHDKFQFNHWGKIKIRFYLNQRLVDPEIINQVLSFVDEASYKQVILEEIIKKKKSVDGKNDFEKKGKIARSVIAKGFEPELVFNLLSID